ncbi:MAG: bifunctional riboflavin kinase/FAD synthetase [bacterium]
MHVFHDLNEFPADVHGTVATLGNFDGVHLGHRKIFRALREEAAALGGNALVVTFFPHPLKVLAPERAPRCLVPLEERIRLIQACGIPFILCLPFTRELADLSPRQFVEEVLVARLGIKKVLVGQDFRFGKGRQGDIALLREMGRTLGFSLRVIQPLQYRGQQVSSTRVRQLIEQGRVRESADLLGRHYGIAGTVIRGDGRGRTLGFPTANIETPAELLPPQGVYAVLASLEGEPIPGVANLGTKPTFPGKPFSIEAYLFDFDQDIYGKRLRMDFVERIREERKFPSVDALVRQMEIDVRAARELLKEEASKPSMACGHC